MSGMILPAGEAEIGSNFPPFHINCRCSARAEEMGSGELLRVDGTESERTEAEAYRDAKKLFNLLRGFNDRLESMDNMFLAHAAVSEAERKRIQKLLEEADEFWRQEKNFELFIQYIKDWMAGLVDAPEDWRMLYFAARGAQLGKNQHFPEYYLPGMEESGYSLEALEQYLLRTNFPGLNKGDIHEILYWMRIIGNGPVDDWRNENGKRLLDIEILARVLYAEQSGVLYNQVESFYTMLNRVFDWDNFNQGRVKIIFTIVKASDQYNPYKTPGGLVTDTKIPDKSNPKAISERDLFFWENAKLMAAYAYVLFGDNTREKLLERYVEILNKGNEGARKEATMEEAYTYFMKILGRLPDVTGVPIGILANEEVFFSSDGGIRVHFKGEDPNVLKEGHRVNVLRKGKVRKIQFVK